MHGLLERAEQYIRSHPFILTGKTDMEGKDDLSDAEKKKLSDDIENLFKGRKPILSAAAHSEPLKKGIAFPLAVNVASAVLLIAFILPFRGFDLFEFQAASGGADLARSTEHMVVQAVIKQSETALKDKLNRISQIQAELNRLRADRRNHETAASVSALEAELSGLQSEAEVRLQLIGEAQRNRDFFIRQVRQIYAAVQGDVASMRFADALENLAAADALLGREDLIPAEELSSLRQTLDPVNAALRLAIRNQALMAQAEETAGLVVKVGEIERLVAMADESAKAGNEAAAAGYYAQALSSLDSVERAHESLRVMQEAAQSRKIGALETDIIRRQSDLAAYQARIEELGTQLEDRGGVIEERTRELAHMKSLVAGRVQALQGSAESLSETAEELIGLLGMKITLKEVLGSETVKTAYPDMYGNLDEFFKSYGHAYSDLGKKQALEDAAASLSTVLSAFPDRVP